jgi:hypothetical protein
MFAEDRIDQFQLFSLAGFGFRTTRGAVAAKAKSSEPPLAMPTLGQTREYNRRPKKSQPACPAFPTALRPPKGFETDTGSRMGTPPPVYSGSSGVILCESPLPWGVFGFDEDRCQMRTPQGVGDGMRSAKR